MHEIGLRILIRRVQLAGSVYDKALIPILSYSKEHYMRVFFKCEKRDFMLAPFGRLRRTSRRRSIAARVSPVNPPVNIFIASNRSHAIIRLRSNQN